MEFKQQNNLQQKNNNNFREYGFITKTKPLVSLIWSINMFTSKCFLWPKYNT